MILALLLTLTTAVEPAPTAASDIDGLLAAEHAFDRASEERGVRDAFLEFLAEKAIVFRPLPVDARQWFTASPDVPGTLAWSPSFAEIAAAGDLGYTTGPWTFLPANPSAEGAPPSQQGHYLSIWKVGTDGVWRVVLDLGVVHPASPEEKLERRVLKRPAGEPKPPLELRRSLRDADIALSQAAAEKGMADALAAAATADVMVLREGSLPAVGVDALRAAEASSPVESWRTSGTDISRSGDLGYTYGKTFRQEGNRAVLSRAYVRIWHRGEDGVWRIALDVMLPLPPPPPPPID